MGLKMKIVYTALITGIVMGTAITIVCYELL